MVMYHEEFSVIENFGVESANVGSFIWEIGVDSSSVSGEFGTRG